VGAEGVEVVVEVAVEVETVEMVAVAAGGRETGTEGMTTGMVGITGLGVVEAVEVIEAVEVL
jgi:hypothetical protein